jgi:hypothetical protein
VKASAGAGSAVPLAIIDLNDEPLEYGEYLLLVEAQVAISRARAAEYRDTLVGLPDPLSDDDKATCGNCHRRRESFPKAHRHLWLIYGPNNVIDALCGACLFPNLKEDSYMQVSLCHGCDRLTHNCIMFDAPGDYFSKDPMPPPPKRLSLIRRKGKKSPAPQSSTGLGLCMSCLENKWSGITVDLYTRLFLPPRGYVNVEKASQGASWVLLHSCLMALSVWKYGLTRDEVARIVCSKGAAVGIALKFGAALRFCHAVNFEKSWTLVPPGVDASCKDYHGQQWFLSVAKLPTYELLEDQIPEGRKAGGPWAVADEDSTPGSSGEEEDE